MRTGNRWLRGALCLLVALVELLCAASALAASEPVLEETAAPAPTDAPVVSEAPQSTDVLHIDNTAVFAGMDAPYQNGYMPLVEDGAVRVVLPLAAARPVLNDTISVAVGLGDPSASPFVFRNYDQTVRLGEHEVNDGSETREAYVVDLLLALAPEREPGRYPVSLAVSGQTAEGAPFEQTYVVYATIPGQSSGSPVEPPGSELENPGGSIDGGAISDTSGGLQPADPSPSEPAPQPKVLISSFSVEPDLVVAGEPFLLSLTLRNTNETQPMRNVKVSVSSEGSDLLPVGDAGSFFFKRIPPAGNVTVRAQMRCAQTAAPGTQRIAVHVDYEGDQRAAYAEVESISVQIRQPLRVVWDEPVVPQEMRAGDTISIAVNVMDMGRSTACNVRASIEAPGLVPEGSLYLGNIESGESKKGELYAFVGTLEDAAQGSSYGSTSGTVTLSYEDELGAQNTEEHAFTAQILPPLIQAQVTKEPEESETQSQWWISALVGGGIICALVLLLLLWKRREKREERDLQPYSPDEPHDVEPSDKASFWRD